MEKLILQEKESPPNGRGTSNVRISNASAQAIHDLAHKARQTDREIADALIEFALGHVELRPVALYELGMRETVGEDSDANVI